jgi:peptidoglycan/xylan/chitin deacetylase (PgdA/CDA1 family)
MLHEARKLPTILWDVDPADWRRPGAAVVAQRIVSGARQGSIVLSHDIQSGTVQAMPAVLKGLSERGLGFTTVSELLGWPRWQTRKFRLAQS